MLNKKYTSKLIIVILFSFFFINANAKTIFNDISNKINNDLKIDTATKGNKLKEYFSDNVIKVIFENKKLQFKFTKNNYEILEDNKVIEKGKWKLSGILKNSIKLKPENKKKSFYFKKINKKNIIYHYNKSPGSENSKKTLVQITSSTKNFFENNTITKIDNNNNDNENKKNNKSENKKKKKINNPLNKLTKDLNKGVKNLLGLPSSNNSSVQNQNNNTQQQHLLEKYRASSNISYYFFEASVNYMQALEFLYRAYDNNVEADKIVSSIDYIKNSKATEADRLNSTKTIIGSGSINIQTSLQDSSYILSETGKGYYAQALPYALGAIESTLNLYNASKSVMQNVSGGQMRGIESLLMNANDLSAAATVIPQIPEFSKNMISTVRLVLSGAKEKKIRNAGNYNQALEELDLTDFED